MIEVIKVKTVSPRLVRVKMTVGIFPMRLFPAKSRCARNIEQIAIDIIECVNYMRINNF
jgi:hypothetical protein